ncbi:hypothetical protein R1flu_028503 [Riccia fluitans]|uniref:Uncharacterized protein n=1 Tax=Riccia fluitans TaxID=41844 RepID=A0ABD1XLY8_9MARC
MIGLEAPNYNLGYNLYRYSWQADPLFRLLDPQAECLLLQNSRPDVETRGGFYLSRPAVRLPQGCGDMQPLREWMLLAGLSVRFVRGLISNLGREGEISKRPRKFQL